MRPGRQPAPRLMAPLLCVSAGPKWRSSREPSCPFAPDRRLPFCLRSTPPARHGEGTRTRPVRRHPGKWGVFGRDMDVPSKIPRLVADLRSRRAARSVLIRHASAEKHFFAQLSFHERRKLVGPRSGTKASDLKSGAIAMAKKQELNQSRSAPVSALHPAPQSAQRSAPRAPSVRRNAGAWWRCRSPRPGRVRRRRRSARTR
jgi:hypothetical protein